MGYADYSLNTNGVQLGNSNVLGAPSLNNSLASFGQAPPMLDYSFGQTGAMPAMDMGGGSGLSLGGYGGMSAWNTGAAGNTPMGSGFGFNMPTLALGLQGLNSLGSLYMGNKSLNLANKQFESAQKFADINMRNQTQTYNDTLENKIKRIGSFNGTSAEETAAEIARRKLPAYA